MNFLILPAVLTVVTFAFAYYMVGHKDKENDLTRGIGVGLVGSTISAWGVVAIIWAWNLAVSAVS